MKKRIKKILAIALSCTLCFSLPVSIQADEPKTNTESVQTQETEVKEVTEESDTGKTESSTDSTISNAVTGNGVSTDTTSVLTVPTVEYYLAGSEEPAATYDVQSTPELTVTAMDTKNQKYEIKLNGYALPDDASSLSFGIWNETQNVVRWYDAVYNPEDQTFGTELDIMDFGKTGTYYLHGYYTKQDGSKAFAFGFQFNITSLPEFNPTISKQAFTDATESQWELELSDYPLADGAQLSVAVWSDANNQADIKWNDMNKTGEYTYSANINVSDYMSPGKYQAHIYCTNMDGSKSYVGGTSFIVQAMTAGAITVEDVKDGTAVVKISGLSSPAGITKVRVPMWSASNQSDMHWYEATKSGDLWSVKVDVANHKNNWAKYNVHTYTTDGHGFEQYTGGTTLDFSVEKQVPTVNVDKDANTATIQLANFKAPGTVTGVSCAVWSEAGGQDDLSWQELTSGSSMWTKTFSVSALKSAGTCYAHAYLTREDGSKVYVGGTAFTIEKPTVGDVEITTDNAAGKFSVTIKDLKSDMGIAKVEVPVWSKADQSDINWYTAEKTSAGNYVVNSDISKHKYNLGSYNVHVYVTDKNGVKTAVACKTMSFSSSFDKIAITNDPKETNYVVTVPNLVYPAGVNKVEFAVWSDAGGQDDCVWYPATRNGSNYQATVNIKNHRTLGTYQVHAYVTNKSGAKVYLTGTSELKVNGNPKASVSVTGQNDANGAFEVTVSGISAPSGVSQVRIAAWTKDNGSDMSWYNCSAQSNGTYKVAVNALYQQHNIGNYKIHAYITMNNGIQSYAGGTTYNFQPKNYMYATTDQGKGKRQVVIVNPTSTNNLRFGVWSEIYGQDDIVWYSASRASDGTYRAIVDASNHKSAGLYQVHAYAGGTLLAGGAIIYINPSEMAKNGWYYENGFKLYYVDGVLQTDVTGIIGPQSQYLAKINRVTNTVTIYAQDGANGFILPVKVFACSVGLPGTPTDTGTFNTMGKYRWKELMGPSYGQYATRIYPGEYFHSVAGVNMTPYNINAGEYNKLGQPASHGCVRLCVRDAKWIYDNCKLGMTVIIYDSSNPGPLGKPATIKIPAGQNWDPTDPSI